MNSPSGDHAPSNSGPGWPATTRRFDPSAFIVKTSSKSSKTIVPAIDPGSIGSPVRTGSSPRPSLRCAAVGDATGDAGIAAGLGGGLAARGDGSTRGPQVATLVTIAATIRRRTSWLEWLVRDRRGELMLGYTT